jgi:hypothetical protein
MCVSTVWGRVVDIEEKCGGGIQRLVSMPCMPSAFVHYYWGIIINIAVIISTIVITARYDRHFYTVNIYIYIYDVITLINRNNEPVSLPKQHYTNALHRGYVLGASIWTCVWLPTFLAGRSVTGDGPGRSTSKPEIVLQSRIKNILDVKME